ncbi:hypothetical protein [Arcobacter arenosus]|jgi:hypothetical protein|uniref:Uncharacterized protein n=1 Tax=Arcobacter arenosus TaxID=2576037 RepID=A0A5R8Y1K5_9BACT|nr:hypothetical protein [Arcobacter arenosus]TLP38345.1 hypothetical protein FDK22_07675 [Arcobacter arenosus]
MSQQNNIEVRKLPKKTVIIIVIMSVICFLGFLFIMFTKNLKMEEVLHDLGHKNITNVKVINKLSVEDKETKVKSTVYKVMFLDKDLNKECIGFVHRSNHGKYNEDFDCK